MPHVKANTYTQEFKDTVIAYTKIHGARAASRHFNISYYSARAWSNPHIHQKHLNAIRKRKCKNKTKIVDCPIKQDQSKQDFPNKFIKDTKKIWNHNVPIDFPLTDNISNSINCPLNELIVWKGIPLTYQYLKTITEDDRDIIAKDLLNFFYQYDFFNRSVDIKVAQDNFDVLCNTDILNIEQKDGKKYITNSGKAGDKIYRQYFPNILKISSPNRVSVYSALNDKKMLFDIIRNRLGNTLLYNTKGRPRRQWPMNITPAMIIQGAKCSGIASMGSIFKPLVAKTIYSNYVKAGDNVLDYSCGFGTRLLGVMSLNLPVMYYGIEPNSETYNNLIRISKDLGFLSKTNIVKKGSEEHIFNVPIHFAFSSPSYFNSEIYSNEETQCYNRYPNYSEWLEKYWRKTVKNIKKMLVKNGTFAVNIGNNSNKFMCQITKDFKRIIEEENFILKDVWWMNTQRSHLSNKRESRVILKQEGIFFYGIR